MVFVIAISGASCSGKSTLSLSLRNHFRNGISNAFKSSFERPQGPFEKANRDWCVLIQQDDFFHQPWSRPLVRVRLQSGVEVENWEEKDAIDWESLEMEIKKAHKLLEEVENEERRRRSKREKGERGDRESVLLVEGFSLLYSSFVYHLADIVLLLDIDPKTAKERRLRRCRFELPLYFDEMIWPYHEKYHSYLSHQYHFTPCSHSLLSKNVEGKPIYSISLLEREKEAFDLSCFHFLLSYFAHLKKSEKQKDSELRFLFLFLFLFLLFFIHFYE